MNTNVVLRSRRGSSSFLLDHGLNPRKKEDKKTYATWLESGKVSEPLQLRGTKKDSATGYTWSRKEEFIAKYKYGVSLPLVASRLEESGILTLSFGCYDVRGFMRYLVSMPGNLEAAYVSVCVSDKGVKKILKAVPVKISGSWLGF